MKKIVLVYLFIFFLSYHAIADSRYFRVMFRDDPATTACIGWDQVSGDNPVVYYGTVDHGTDHTLYPNQQVVARTVGYRGMNNHFARLTGLEPNTAYYFVIRDSEGNSDRYWFKTCPDAPTRMSFIMGGDSRNNRTPRQKANRLVSKLKPHAVLFAGDMTNGDSNGEWNEWMLDWQESIHANGRIIPIVATRGNHEGSNDVIYNLFDVPSPDAYYAITFGGSLVRAYTLNTEMSIGGAQTDWLANDLINNATSVQWKVAQYHKPIRPHVGFKPEGNAQYANWAPLFYDFGVNLVVECDAHTVKRTWPLRPSTAAEAEEGFVREDATGTVYIGEGCWGAPLRTNDDNKSWTRNSDSFNQFNWVFIDENEIEIRTIAVDNEENVGEVNNNDIFTPPANLDIWEPDNGALVEIPSSQNNISPIVEISKAEEGSYFPDPQFVTIQAQASDLDGNITRVEFFVDGELQFTDNTAPYSASLFLDNGVHEFTAQAYDNGNRSASKSLTLSAGSFVHELEVRIVDGADDVEERQPSLDLYTNSSDLEMINDGGTGQKIGLRFQEVIIPRGASVMEAFIQFKADVNNSIPTNLNIFGEDADDSAPFGNGNGAVSARTITDQTVLWTPPPWITGDEGKEQRTPDLSGIVQSIVNRSGWASAQSMSFIVSGLGTRTAVSFEGDASGAPLLLVKYSVGDISYPDLSITSFENEEKVSLTLGDSVSITATASDPAGVISEVRFYVDGVLVSSDNAAPFQAKWKSDSYGPHQVRVVAENEAGAQTSEQVYIDLRDESLQEMMVQIGQGSDDAEESTSGEMVIADATIDLVNDPDQEGATQTIGLRFNDLDIPQGSEIGYTYLQFTASAPGNHYNIFEIRGEKSPNPEAFSTAPGDLSARTTTLRRVRWFPEIWMAEGDSTIAQRTPNIQPVVQELVDQDDWNGGQSMVFLITGEGLRNAFSFEGSEESAPKLYISFAPNDVLSTEPEKKPQLLVYPTLVEETLTIKNLTSQQLIYSIIDNRGATLQSGSIAALDEKKVSVRTFDRGLYYVRTRNALGFETHKFVKE